VKTRLLVPSTADANAIEKMALADPKVIEMLAGKSPKKIIVVPGRLVNIVA
jgi:leucyl-tRNA synthetase